MKKHICWFAALAIGLALPGITNSSTIIADPASAQALAERIEQTPGGGVLRAQFRSKIDDTLQPILLKVPSDYTNESQWPLLVVLHGWGDDPIIVPSIDSMVQLGPFGRGNLWYRGVGEKDVFEAIDAARQIFNIDPERIYLVGFSMGGTGTFELGLKHPDFWAACVAVCGPFSKMELVPNGTNLPFWIVTGSRDTLVPPDQSRAAYELGVDLGFEHWKYSEYENVGHSFSIEWDKVEVWLLEHKRITKPAIVHYRSDDARRSYWLEVLEKKQPALPCVISAHIYEQQVQMKTENVSNYELHLSKAPIDISELVRIVENGKTIFHGTLDSNGIFNKNSMGN